MSKPMRRSASCCRASAAFVHHGGIGSVAQALAAGTPQMAVPAAYDQPDNGVRIERLGVGVAIAPRKFNASRGVAALDRVLERGYAARLRRRKARACERPDTASRRPI